MGLPSAPISLLLVGADDAYRSALRLLLEQVLGEPVAVDRRSSPGGVVLIELWDHDPRTALGDVRRLARRTRVVVIVRTPAPELAAALRAAGALGVVGEWSGVDELVRAIREAAAGRAYVDARLEDGESAVERPADLTATDLRILALIAAGHTNAEIARALHRSVRSVEGYRAALVRKLGTGRRADLVQMARALGLASAPLMTAV